MALTKTHKIAMFVLALVSFILFLVVGLQSNQLGLQAEPTVRDFPNAEVELLTEQRVASNTLFDAPYQLVNVWASWCGYCKAEHPFLNQLAENGIAIVGLNYRDSRGAASRYLGSAGNPYTSVIFDSSGLFSIDLGVVGTPETYVVTREGQIAYKYSGALTGEVWQRHFVSFFEQELVDDQ
ncbi:DsbE family thiol:disulfide interchange protein [Vibrio maerlii]|uniref:DsbE family thiol:disulfide interchange protein n=1 Tax=Vibrio maerlii TaxID=2231648 RepID=UPI000E3DB6F7|nr:DsbE family thiol:disulfide interchange protein [Vibrio maerlii]